MTKNLKLKKIFKILNFEKDLASTSALLLASTVIGGGLGFISTILLSRILNPHNFGIFKTLTGIYGFAIYFLDFGFQNTLVKYLSEFSAQNQKGKANQLVQNLFLLRFVILIFIIALSLTFRQNIASLFLKNENLSYLIYHTLIFTFVAFLDLSRAAVIGLQNFQLIAVINIIVPLASILILIPLAYFFGLPAAIIGAAAAYLTGSLVSLGFLFKNKFHQRLKSPFIFPKLVFSYGLPSYFSALPSYIFLAIIPLLSLFFPQNKVGYFAFSLSFYTVGMVVPGTISQILFPKIAALAAASKASAQAALFRALKIYLPVILFEIIFASAFAKPVILLFAPQFIAAYSLVVILVATAAFLGIGTILITYFTATHKLKIAFCLNFAAGVIFTLVAFIATKVTL